MQIQVNQHPSKIVAVVGALAAGKDALADYLQRQYAVVAVEVGEFARQLAEEAGKEDAKPYDATAQQMAEHGPEYLITCLVKEISQNEEWQSKPIIITGVRTPAEAKALKEQFGSNLLLSYIRVGDQAARFDRVQQRHLSQKFYETKRYPKIDRQPFSRR